ncbi:MAG: hypothetical protein WCX65_03490 [bacterium]
MEETEKTITPEQKVAILREHILNGAEPAGLAEKHGAAPDDIRLWLEALLDHAQEHAGQIFREKAFDIPIAPYKEWPKTTLSDPRNEDKQAIKEKLVEIIDAEGPMRAISAYQTYVKAAGISKVGGLIKQIFNGILQEAIAEELILMRDEGEDKEYCDRIVRSLTAPEVSMRQLGPRGLDEIPPAEIASVMREILKKEPALEDEKLFRAILDIYGLKMLTAKAANTLSRIRDMYIEKINSGEAL